MKIEASYTWSAAGTSETVTACVDSSLPEGANETGELVAAIVRALICVKKRKLPIEQVRQ